jgi:hypothetical protein
MENAPRRRYVHVLFDEHIHEALSRQASITGQHISDLVEEYAIEKLNEHGDDSDPNIRLYKQIEASRSKERIVNNLRNLVWKAVREEDEDQLATLKITCDDLKISFDSILEFTQDNSSEPIVYDNPNGISAAMVWLNKNMLAGQPYKATDMFQLARIQGFSDGVVNAAKGNLGIKSNRSGSKWYWVRS